MHRQQVAASRAVLRMEMILPVRMGSLQMEVTITEIPSRLLVTEIMEITEIILPVMEIRPRMEMAMATEMVMAMVWEMATAMEVAAETVMVRETAMETVTEVAAEEEPVRALQHMIMLPFQIKSGMTALCMETKLERTIPITTGRRMVLPGKVTM